MNQEVIEVGLELRMAFLLKNVEIRFGGQNSQWVILQHNYQNWVGEEQQCSTLLKQEIQQKIKQKTLFSRVV